MGALVDAARGRVVGVALAEGDQVPREPAVGVLAEPEDEAERRRGSAFGIKRHVELATARQHRLVGTLRLTPFPVERFPACFDFPARAFGLKTDGRSLVQATHLFLPDRLTGTQPGREADSVLAKPRAQDMRPPESLPQGGRRREKRAGGLTPPAGQGVELLQGATRSLPGAGGGRGADGCAGPSGPGARPGAPRRELGSGQSRLATSGRLDLPRRPHRDRRRHDREEPELDGRRGRRPQVGSRRGRRAQGRSQPHRRPRYVVGLSTKPTAKR